MKCKSIAFFIVATLISFATIAQTTVRPAASIIAAAYKQAGEEKKSVLIIFHASWCGWCKKMDAALEDPICKPFFDKYFVIEHLTVQESKGKEYLENPGAQEQMDKWEGKGMGLPYWVVLDKEGTVLFDSQVRKTQPDNTVKGENIGCPATKEEVLYFTEILRKTTNLSSNDLQVIFDRFRKNEQK